MGGRSGTSPSSASLDVYDPVTNSWTTKAAIPTARREGAAGAVVNGVLYVIGGRNAAGNYITTVEGYNPATNTWVTKAGLAVARTDLGAVGYNSSLYAIGGRNSTTLLATNESYRP